MCVGCNGHSIISGNGLVVAHRQLFIEPGQSVMTFYGGCLMGGGWFSNFLLSTQVYKWVPT